MYRFASSSKQFAFRSQTELSNDTIARYAPSVLAESAHSSRGERYTFIPTIRVIDALRVEGFQPFEVRQTKVRDLDKREHTKHMVRLRHVSSINGDEVPEIVLLNSHDGTTSEKMFGGFFRFACKNGSIFFDGEATEVRVPHTGNILDKVIEGAYTVLNQAQNAITHVETFQSLQLNRDEQMALATAARALRFEDEHAVRPEQLLQTRRMEDLPGDLWTTFNRVQENVMRGGLSYTQVNPDTRRETRRTTQAVRSVDGDVKLNRALWVLAE